LGKEWKTKEDERNDTNAQVQILRTEGTEFVVNPLRRLGAAAGGYILSIRDPIKKGKKLQTENSAVVGSARLG